MKIYTKTGDKGKTSLFDGTRVYKNHVRLDTYGTLDEASTILGVAAAFLPKENIMIPLIQSVQKDLLDIGACLANPQKPVSGKFTAYVDERIAFFESTIDEMTSRLPALTNFILFTGNKPASFLQQARAVIRRSERQLVALSQQEAVDTSFVRYLNRLSDLLYTMGRFANTKKEIAWKAFE